MPTLDEVGTLPRLLERLDPARSDAPEELIIVDGGSRDGTLALVRENPAVTRVVEGPACRGAQLALGGSAARSELLLFLHADCLPSPGGLEPLRDVLGEPGVAGAGFAQHIAAEGPFFRTLERWRRLRIPRGSVYGDSGLALSTALYRELEGHRPWPLFEDLELSKRVARRGRMCVVPDAVLEVHARRWLAHGPLRTTIRNRMLYLGYRLGVTPERLARYYAPAPLTSRTRGESPAPLSESNRP